MPLKTIDQSGRFLKAETLSKEFLHQAYVVENKSAKEIARDLNCSDFYISRCLNEHGFRRKTRGEHRRENLTDQRFDKLLVLERIGDKYLCRCDCGNEFTTSSYKLKLGSRKRQCYNCASPCLNYQNLPRIYWTTLIKGAKKRDIEFAITMEYAWQLFEQQNGLCKLTGIQLNFAKNKREHMTMRKTTASLDRIDSTKGYIIGNVQWVHKDINRMKQHFSEQYFKELCKKVIDYDNKQNP